MSATNQDEFRQNRWSSGNGRSRFFKFVGSIFLGHGILFYVGTTTAVSVLLLFVNGFQVQDLLSQQIAAYFLRHSMLDVSFGEKIVPSWSNGRILFRDLTIKSSDSPAWQGHSLYDLTINRVEVSLSIFRWLAGRGLIVSCNISGVRGTIDRSKVNSELFRDWRYESQPGDFQLLNVAVSDFAVTIDYGDDSVKNVLSILSAKLPRLRKRFLLYDILTAESIVGMLDGSLFSLHVPQVLIPDHPTASKCYSMRHLKMHSMDVAMFGAGNSVAQSTAVGPPLGWLYRGSVDLDVFIQLPSTKSELTLDDDYPLLDKLSSTIGVMTDKILIEILRKSGLPNFGAENSDFFYQSSQNQGLLDEEEFGNLRSELSQIRGSLISSVGEHLRSQFWRKMFNIDHSALDTPEKAAAQFLNASPNCMAFKVDFRFHNLKARIPWNIDHSSLQTTLMRPVVAYINEQRPFIPLSCHFEIDQEKFDGAWTVHESNIAQRVSDCVAESFSNLASDKNRRNRRLQKVSLWSFYSIIRHFRNLLDEAKLNSVSMSPTTIS